MKYGLIVCPVWDIGVYHPHQERAGQWLESFARNNIIPILVSLSVKRGTVTLGSGKAYLAVHPGIGYSQFVKKDRLTQLAVIDRLAALLRSVSGNYQFSVVIVSHPMLLKLVSSEIIGSRVIVDFPNAPSSIGDLMRWGFDDIRDFVASVSHCRLSVYHRGETILLCNIGIQENRIHIVPPEFGRVKLIQKRKPGYLVLHGRRSEQNRERINKLIQGELNSDFLREAGLRLAICGEVSSLFEPSPLFRLVPPLADLDRILNSNVCPVIVSDSFSGISYRVKDIISSGGYLILTRLAAQGYDLDGYPHILENSDTLRYCIRALLSDYSESYKAVRKVQGKIESSNRRAILATDSLVSDN